MSIFDFGPWHPFKDNITRCYRFLKRNDFKNAERELQLITKDGEIIEGEFGALIRLIHHFENFIIQAHTSLGKMDIGDTQENLTGALEKLAEIVAHLKKVGWEVKRTKG